MGGRHLHAAEGQRDAAADVHRLGLFDPLLSQPVANFEIRHHRGPGPLGDLGRVGDVIEMAVRDQHDIGETSSALTGAVGESSRNGSTRIVCSPVATNQVACPNQVSSVIAMPQLLWPECPSRSEIGQFDRPGIRQL